MDLPTRSEPWVSINDAAAHLGVHAETVRRWVKHASMPASKVGKVWRFKLSEVDVWVKAGGATSAVQDKSSP